MKNLTKILIGTWLFTIFTMWNVGPKYQNRVKVIDLKENLGREEAMKYTPSNLETERFFNRNSDDSFVLKRKIYALREKTWIPFVYKKGNLKEKTTEAIYTH